MFDGLYVVMPKKTRIFCSSFPIYFDIFNSIIFSLLHLFNLLGLFFSSIFLLLSSSCYFISSFYPLSFPLPLHYPLILNLPPVLLSSLIFSLLFPSLQVILLKCVSSFLLSLFLHPTLPQTQPPTRPEGTNLFPCSSLPIIQQVRLTTDREQHTQTQIS